MRAVCLAAIAFLAFAASPAMADDKVCSGEAKGPSGSAVQVSITLGGRAATTSADWTPPSSSKDMFPMLSIGYRVADGALGDATQVGVTHAIDTSHLPMSSRAAMVIRLDDKKPWAR